jgi:hypothetical protein
MTSSDNLNSVLTSLLVKQCTEGERWGSTRTDIKTEIKRIDVMENGSRTRPRIKDYVDFVALSQRDQHFLRKDAAKTTNKITMIPLQRQQKCHGRRCRPALRYRSVPTKRAGQALASKAGGGFKLEPYGWGIGMIPSMYM